MSSGTSAVMSQSERREPMRARGRVASGSPRGHARERRPARGADDAVEIDGRGALGHHVICRQAVPHAVSAAAPWGGGTSAGASMIA